MVVLWVRTGVWVGGGLELEGGAGGSMGRVGFGVVSRFRL